MGEITLTDDADVIKSSCDRDEFPLEEEYQNLIDPFDQEALFCRKLFDQLPDSVRDEFGFLGDESIDEMLGKLGSAHNRSLKSFQAAQSVLRTYVSSGGDLGKPEFLSAYLDPAHLPSDSVLIAAAEGCYKALHANISRQLQFIDSDQIYRECMSQLFQYPEFQALPPAAKMRCVVLFHYRLPPHARKFKSSDPFVQGIQSYCDKTQVGEYDIKNVPLLHAGVSKKPNEFDVNYIGFEKMRLIQYLTKSSSPQERYRTYMQTKDEVALKLVAEIFRDEMLILHNTQRARMGDRVTKKALFLHKQWPKALSVEEKYKLISAVIVDFPLNMQKAFLNGEKNPISSVFVRFSDQVDPLAVMNEYKTLEIGRLESDYQQLKTWSEKRQFLDKIEDWPDFFVKDDLIQHFENRRREIVRQEPAHTAREMFEEMKTLPDTCDDLYSTVSWAHFVEMTHQESRDAIRLFLQKISRENFENMRHGSDLVRSTSLESMKILHQLFTMPNDGNVDESLELRIEQLSADDLIKIHHYIHEMGYVGDISQALSQYSDISFKNEFNGMLCSISIDLSGSPCRLFKMVGNDNFEYIMTQYSMIKNLCAADPEQAEQKLRNELGIKSGKDDAIKEVIDALALSDEYLFKREMLIQAMEKIVQVDDDF